MSSPLTVSDVLERLRTFQHPNQPQLGDIVTCQMVAGVTVDHHQIVVSLLATAEDAKNWEPWRQKVTAALQTLPGAGKVFVVFTDHKEDPANNPKGRAIARGQWELPQFKHIIAVGSGKGGVGKSTICLNLAASLQRLGLKVGLLDADIYGPSVPKLLGLNTKAVLAENKKLQVVEAHGLFAASIGFLIDEEQPVIWRGPMVQSAVRQLLQDVNWPALDVLLIDLPPGTGDIHLTLVQKVPLSGAVIVSTPQDLALLDARKALAMFQKLNVPILGLVENMSLFTCPNCGHESAIFTHGGAEKEAERLQVPFLGAIPLHMALRESADAGKPYVQVHQDSTCGVFQHAAEQIIHHLSHQVAA